MINLDMPIFKSHRIIDVGLDSKIPQLFHDKRQGDFFTILQSLVAKEWRGLQNFRGYVSIKLREEEKLALSDFYH